MRGTVDAVYEKAVFRPMQRMDLSEGERVRLTVEREGVAAAEDILRLAARVYEGLSAQDVEEIQEMLRGSRLGQSGQ